MNWSKLQLGGVRGCTSLPQQAGFSFMGALPIKEEIFPASMEDLVLANITWNGTRKSQNYSIHKGTLKNFLRVVDYSDIKKDW